MAAFPMIDNPLGGRSVPEWIGSSPDAKVPPRVRLRVLRAHDNRCYLTGREIRPGDAWEIEHKVALILGGQHRESNLAPALAEPHKRKTAAEMKVKAKTDALAKRLAGIVDPPKMQGRKFPRTSKSARREANASKKPSLPPKPLYTRHIEERNA